MKLLLDENLPKRLKDDYPVHQVFTVRDMNWNGIKNGELMKLILENDFDAFLTFDKNLQYQQNFQKFKKTIFIFSAANNTYLVLTKLSPQVNEYLNLEILPTGPIVINQK